MTAPAVPAVAPAARRRPGTGTVLRWEAAKLAAQVRSRALLIGAIVVPIAVVLIFNSQLPPKDTIYGRHIHTSGYAAVRARLRSPMGAAPARGTRRR
jgi:ABC-2 type transport system permease protein